MSGEGVTIEQLAGDAGVSVRNIRYYQSLGLIDAPERRGRLAFYDESHLARLRRVCELREQGLSLDAISRLLDSPDSGLVHFAQALLEGTTSETPQRVTLEELRSGWPQDGGPVDERRLLDSPFFDERSDGDVEVRSPALWRMGSQLAELDVPFSDAVELLGTLEEHLGAIAQRYAQLFVARVWRPAIEAEDGVEWAQLEDAFVRLRELAGESVAAAFALVMTDETERTRQREIERNESAG